MTDSSLLFSSLQGTLELNRGLFSPLVSVTDAVIGEAIIMLFFGNKLICAFDVEAPLVFNSSDDKIVCFFEHYVVLLLIVKVLLLLDLMRQQWIFISLRCFSVLVLFVS